ncbi:MAG: hypothetical protein M1822_003864 [Bathelium mastoideum]|nr:MAG: hypothetical protein M1822_003864 [Bathelium mastoideum]
MHPQIAVPAIFALLYRAYSRKSLTPLGLVVAGLTATIHALHPWSIFFTLLGVFFLAGTAVTKVKHDVKARLTHSASGAAGGEGPRTHVQVLANSLVATILIALHTWKLAREPGRDACWPHGHDVLVVGIVANYAAVAADTFSSELGILSPSPPRLLTSLAPPLRPVPRGTNGGVTATGLLAGLAGAALIAGTTLVLLPFCGSAGGSYGAGAAGWSVGERLAFAGAMTVVGALGSVLDSVLGGVLQASVVDVRSGKVVEGDGGGKVLVSGTDRTGGDDGQLKGRQGSARNERTSRVDSGKPSRRIESGWDILSNNGVNLMMAATISVGAMLGACWVWQLPVSTILR